MFFSFYNTYINHYNMRYISISTWILLHDHV
jgi:hypothetical protein